MIKITDDRKNKIAFVSIFDADKRIKKGLRKGLQEIGKENRKHTRALIRSGHKTGRRYRFRGRWHQASAPGEAPASMTGELAKSVGYKTRGWHTLEFGDRAKHGKFLEDGTRRMQPRPHLRTTVRQRSRSNYNILVQNTTKEIEATR